MTETLPLLIDLHPAGRAAASWSGRPPAGALCAEDSGSTRRTVRPSYCAVATSSAWNGQSRAGRARLAPGWRPSHRLHRDDHLQGEVDYTHRWQRGEAGEFARVQLLFGLANPVLASSVRAQIVGGAVPAEFAPKVEQRPGGCEVGRAARRLSGGGLIGSAARRRLPRLNSSADGIRYGGPLGLQATGRRRQPALLEPIMQVEVVAPRRTTERGVGRHAIAGADPSRRKPTATRASSWSSMPRSPTCSAIATSEGDHGRLGPLLPGLQPLEPVDAPFDDDPNLAQAWRCGPDVRPRRRSPRHVDKSADVRGFSNSLPPL